MRWNELGDHGTMKANGTNNGDFFLHMFVSGSALTYFRLCLYHMKRLQNFVIMFVGYLLFT